MKISEALKRCGISVLEDHDYWWICSYCGFDIYICLTSGTCDRLTFTLYINDEKICTRCNFRTLIQKIKSYK